MGRSWAKQNTAGVDGAEVCTRRRAGRAGAVQQQHAATTEPSGLSLSGRLRKTNGERCEHDGGKGGKRRRVTIDAGVPRGAPRMRMRLWAPGEETRGRYSISVRHIPAPLKMGATSSEASACTSEHFKEHACTPARRQAAHFFPHLGERALPRSCSFFSFVFART